MDSTKEELDRLSYEVWEVYQLIRILVLIIDINNETQGFNKELFSLSILAEIIEQRLAPIPDDLDDLALKQL